MSIASIETLYECYNAFYPVTGGGGMRGRGTNQCSWRGSAMIKSKDGRPKKDIEASLNMEYKERAPVRCNCSAWVSGSVRLSIMTC